MKALRLWSLFPLAALGLPLGCGSEGSLASQGSNDWTYPGMSGRNATGGTSPGTGGSVGHGGTTGAASGGSGNTTATGGTSASGGSGGTDATGGSSGTGGASASGGTATDVGGSAGDTSSGGSTSGGSSTGGSSTGGSATGGSSTGGSSTGGSSTGGSSTGGSSTGGSASSLYHQLSNWVEPAAGNANHHGRAYFLANGHKDENGLECTSCHGDNYQGDSGPACASCHSTWRSDCSFCHGSSSTAANPARGVWDEMTTDTLAVGRHDAHLAAGSSHLAFACSTCHTIPPGEDVDHTLSYQPSDDLSTPGHHGDVKFASSVSSMSFSLSATSGSPVSSRGTCVGACHSDGRGGNPVKTPYWAGGTWATGCGNCHASSPSTGRHKHSLDQGATCADCHSGSTTSKYASASHLNGMVDFVGTVQGQGMTLKADSTCSSGVRCNGTCHGNNEGHNNACW